MGLKDINGLGDGAVKKLAEAGIVDLMGLATTPIKELAEKSGVTETKARKFSIEARKLLDIGFVNAEKFEANRKLRKITTGVLSFDKMMGGGIESGAITMFYGKNSVGKSQLAMLLSVTAQLQNPKGVIYIDSEGCFRSSRVNSFAKTFKVKNPLKNIMVARAKNFEHQVLLLEKAEEMVATGDYGTVIIDSISSHIRSEYIGRGMLAERQQTLNKHIHHLLKIVDCYNVVGIITNQIMSNPGIVYGNTEQSVGGNVLHHTATNIVYIRIGKAGSRVAKLVDSPDLPSSDCNFYIKSDKFEEIEKVK
jgi:DNA repair protein RadA